MRPNSANRRKPAPSEPIALNSDDLELPSDDDVVFVASVVNSAIASLFQDAVPMTDDQIAAVLAAMDDEASE